MFLIQCATSVEVWLQKMGDFYEIPHLTTEHLKFLDWKYLDQSALLKTQILTDFRSYCNQPWELAEQFVVFIFRLKCVIRVLLI